MATPTCSECLTGSVKEGTPTGVVTTLHSLNTYVARPEGTPRGLVVMIPDVFGWEISNSRLLADSYAKKGGFLVYLPDFMAGLYPSNILISLTNLSRQCTTIIYHARNGIRPCALIMVHNHFLQTLLASPIHHGGHTFPPEEQRRGRQTPRLEFLHCHTQRSRNKQSQNRFRGFLLGW